MTNLLQSSGIFFLIGMTILSFVYVFKDSKELENEGKKKEGKVCKILGISLFVFSLVMYILHFVLSDVYKF